jgi:hypothetical protein
VERALVPLGGEKALREEKALRGEPKNERGEVPICVECCVEGVPRGLRTLSGAEEGRSKGLKGETIRSSYNFFSVRIMKQKPLFDQRGFSIFFNWKAGLIAVR